jgi:hypothetical protein
MRRSSRLKGLQNRSASRSHRPTQVGRKKAKLKESRKANRGPRAVSLSGMVEVAGANPRRNLSVRGVPVEQPSKAIARFRVNA